MRVLSLTAAALLLIVLMTAGCNRNDQTANSQGKSNTNSALNARSNTAPDNVRRVTITELRDMLEQDKVVVIDVRGDAMYEQEHIKGALDIPENLLTARVAGLPKDKLIVLYCS